MTPTPKADFVPLCAGHTHDLILLEWTTKDPKAVADDGGAARAVPDRASVRSTLMIGGLGSLPQTRPFRARDLSPL